MGGCCNLISVTLPVCRLINGYTFTEKGEYTREDTHACIPTQLQGSEHIRPLGAHWPANVAVSEGWKYSSVTEHLPSMCDRSQVQFPVKQTDRHTPGGGGVGGDERE